MKKSSHFYCYSIFFALIIPLYIVSMNEESPYLPIILVSGISANEHGMDPMIKLIKKHLPNIYVKHVEIGWGEITSFWDMYDQIEDLNQALKKDPNLQDGFNIVAHSQGGLNARYFIERYNYPQVYNYIALGSPQRGVFGIPSDIDMKCPNFKWLEHHCFSPLLYTWLFQNCLSFADYWNDSIDHGTYLNKCSFLPYLNNEKEHEFFQLFKENICKLHNMVLVQSTKEYVVEPAESCHFGFYKEGSMTEIEPLFSSEIYKNDTLGLKTLYESNRLHLRTADCLHTQFESDEKNFVNNVLPFLKVQKEAKSNDQIINLNNK